MSASFKVALFQSVSASLKAEAALKAEGVFFKIIPVPKSISSECGICVRFLPGDEDRIVLALSGASLSFSIQDLS